MSPAHQHPAGSGPACDEETARAELYGLLARLYYAPPPADLATALRTAETDAPVAGSHLEEPWRVLVAAARACDDQAIADEYAALFGGMARPDVYLYGSHYLSGFLNEKPLVKLRGMLAQLGLARAPSVTETEDHLACLCDAMRYLIAAHDDTPARLEQQAAFFAEHLQPWVGRLIDAIAAHPRARFYAAVAGFTRAFIEIETQGFDMLA